MLTNFPEGFAPPKIDRPVILPDGWDMRSVTARDNLPDLIVAKDDDQRNAFLTALGWLPLGTIENTRPGWSKVRIQCGEEFDCLWVAQPTSITPGDVYQKVICGELPLRLLEQAALVLAFEPGITGEQGPRLAAYRVHRATSQPVQS